MQENETEKLDALWIEAVISVTFDLEEGQVVESCYPKNRFPEKLLKLIGYFSFPDSYVLTNEGELFYSYQLKFEHEPLFCYSLFAQKKDASNPRGYFQKSLVIISKHRLVKIFRVIVKELGKCFFSDSSEPQNLSKETSSAVLCKFFECFFNSINSNLAPRVVIKTGKQFCLKFMDCSPKVNFKRVYNPVFRFPLRHSIIRQKMAQTDFGCKIKRMPSWFPLSH